MALKIYLAGPDVFRRDALAIGEAKKQLCSQYGFQGLFPLDNSLDLSNLSPYRAGIAIYQANEELMQLADMIIANMTPFRSPGMDQGTAFEMGYLNALGKTIHGYSLEPRLYSQRVEHDADGFDQQGLQVESFEMADNLMMIGAIEKSEGKFLTMAGDDSNTADHLRAFEALLKQL